MGFWDKVKGFFSKNKDEDCGCGSGACKTDKEQK